MKINFRPYESTPAFKGCSIVKSNKHIPTSAERDTYFLRGILKRINPKNINANRSYFQQKPNGDVMRATFQNGKSLRISPALITFENGKKMYFIKIPFNKNEASPSFLGLLEKLTNKLSKTLTAMTEKID